MYTPDTGAMVFTIMGLCFREYHKSGIGRAGAFLFSPSPHHCLGI